MDLVCPAGSLAALKAAVLWEEVRDRLDDFSREELADLVGLIRVRSVEVVTRGLHEQRAGHDQRFLVGERNRSTALDSRHRRRVQSR